jgi:hypothetical protein
VDIERLKSKYFVDMMRAKDNEEMPNVNSKQNNILGVKRREFLAEQTREGYRGKAYGLNIVN